MASEKELVLSRFEEGKPADPTENMSPEDAKRWWEEHEKNKDRFKASSIRIVARYEKASRKPQSIPERHQLKILIDTIKNPLKGKFLGGPTAEEAEETLRTKFDYTDAEIRRLKQASIHNAGWSHAIDVMQVLFVEGRKPVPFNIDTIKEISTTFIPVLGDDGEMHDANLNVIGHQSSGPLTYQQEKTGMRRETQVTIQFPVDEGGSPHTSERTVLAALVRLGKKLGFQVEPSRPGYKPQTRKI
jgi:hypothetical protein